MHETWEGQHKTRADIAREAGFSDATFATMRKASNSTRALNQVSALAKALEVKSSVLMRLAITLRYGVDILKLLADLLGEALTANEREWLKIRRDQSAKTNPTPAYTIRRVLLQDACDLFFRDPAALPVRLFFWRTDQPKSADVSEEPITHRLRRWIKPATSKLRLSGRS